MDGSQGYEHRVYYTPTMGYDAGSSVVANPGPDHRHDHEQHHQPTAQLHQQGQQPQWQPSHVPYTHVQYSAGGASHVVPNSPLQAPIFATPAHQNVYFGDTSAWQQQQQQQQWPALQVAAHAPATATCAILHAPCGAVRAAWPRRSLRTRAVRAGSTLRST